jgi:NAD(P)-dependent dehydrogenase (short-subunit alcohol dehydrogenase family)
LAGDVKDPEDLQRVVDAAIGQHGRIDCLVNNAGYHPPHKPIDEFTQEEFEDVLRGNLLSCFTGCRIALPHLRKTKGSVINLGSLVAEIGQELATIYCATKGGLLSFTKSLAIEEARHGVRVNCVQPGNVFSDSMRKLIESPGGRRHYDWITANQHVGRVATTEEVGQLCLFLASDAARYLTGISINLSGGAELGYGTKFPLHCAE